MLIDGKEYRLVQNRAKCLVCEETIESKHLRDFRTCWCGSLSLNGGIEDPKVLFVSGYEDLRVWEHLGTRYMFDGKSMFKSMCTI